MRTNIIIILILIQILLIVFYTYKISTGTITTLDAVMLGINISGIITNLFNLTA